MYAIRSRGEDPDKVKALWEELIGEFEKQNNKRPKLSMAFSGNDYQVLPSFLDKEFCGQLDGKLREFVEERKKDNKSKKTKKGETTINMIDLARYLKKCIFDNITIGHVIKRGRELIGDEQFIEEGDDELGVSLQIFKVDRYETISSFEMDFRLRREIRLYVDVKALYLFLLGLLNSYVDGVVVRDKEGRASGYDYYFLLFSSLSTASSDIENALEGRGIDLLMSIKNRIRGSLGKTLSSIRGFAEEIFAIAALLNSETVKEMKYHGINVVNLRLLRIRKEGNVYKVYNEIPLSLDATKKIYSDVELVKKLENIFKGLLKPAGRFLRGEDTYGDGYHAYEALRYLYMYIVTEDSQLLTNFYRELASAYKIVENKSPGDALRYLRLMSWRPMTR